MPTNAKFIRWLKSSATLALLVLLVLVNAQLHSNWRAPTPLSLSQLSAPTAAPSANIAEGPKLQTLLRIPANADRSTDPAVLPPTLALAAPPLVWPQLVPLPVHRTNFRQLLGFDACGPPKISA